MGGRADCTHLDMHNEHSRIYIKFKISHLIEIPAMKDRPFMLTIVDIYDKYSWILQKSLIEDGPSFITLKDVNILFHRIQNTD